MIKLLNLSLAILFLLFRFYHLDLAPFVLDEAVVQHIVDRAMALRAIPNLGLPSILGGVPYGGTGELLYIPIRLCTDSISWIVAWHAFFATLSILIIGWVLWRESRDIAVSFLTLSSTSFFLYFHSRLAWDNTWQLFFTAVVFFYVSQLKERFDEPKKVCLLGIALGLLLSVHLMSVAFVLATLLFLFFKHRKAGAKYHLMLYVIILGVNFAYIPHLLSHQMGIHDGLPITQRIVEVLGLSVGTLRFDYADSILGQQTLLSRDHVVLLITGALVPLTLYCLIRQAHQYLFSYLLFLYTAHCLYLIALNLPAYHPYYINPIWMVAPIAIARLQRTALSIAFVQGIIVLSFAIRIERDHGTRNWHYASAHRELEDALSTACSTDINTLNFDISQVYVTSPALTWIFEHNEKCRGKALQGTPNFQIRYQGSGARLTAVPLPPPAAGAEAASVMETKTARPSDEQLPSTPPVVSETPGSRSF